MAVSISHIAMEVPQAPSIKSEVGPRNNPVDFEVTGIEIGNSTVSPKVWEQPDSTNLEYLTKGEAIQVNVTFLQRGSIHPQSLLMPSWKYGTPSEL